MNESIFGNELGQELGVWMQTIGTVSCQSYKLDNKGIQENERNVQCAGHQAGRDI